MLDKINLAEGGGMLSRLGRGCLAASIAVIWVVGCVAAPRADELGFYTKISAIGTVGKVKGVSNTSTGPFAGLAVAAAETDETDLVAGPAAALGYWWGPLLKIPIRTEIEYVLRYRFDYDASPVAFASGTPAGINSNVQTHSGMVNVFYDIETDTRFLPYIGFGVGFARTETNTRFTNKSTGISERNVTASSNNFAWSLNAGMIYEMTSDWGLELGYRYIDLGNIAIGPSPSGTRLDADSYVSHDILIGILYRL
jgi:opacity protein-like surface antigen